jgi:hypothetical protein
MARARRVKALSVRQPWAWAIICGFKDIENRTEGAIKQIGPRAIGQRIYIHAAKTMPRWPYENAAKFMKNLGVKCPEPGKLLRGGIIGTVSVLDVVRKSKSPWFSGPCGLVLADRCKFKPLKRQLGLFKVIATRSAE